MTTMFPSSAITEIPTRRAIVGLANQRQTPSGGGARYQSHAQETKGGDLCPIFAYCVHPIVQKMGWLWAACYKQSALHLPVSIDKRLVCPVKEEAASFFTSNPHLLDIEYYKTFHMILYDFLFIQENSWDNKKFLFSILSG